MCLCLCHKYKHILEMSIPHLFRCPISLDLFTDPVTLSTGQTYDRPSIERWLAAGNTTCPVTMQRLHDTSIVPNRTLRHLIDQWLLSVPQQHTHSNFKDTGSGTAFSLASLKLSLQSPDSAATTKLEILKKVRILSAESDTGRACLIQLGYFPLLLQLLFQTPIDSELAEVGLDCVLSLLPSAQLDSLNILNKESNLASFLVLLEQGNVRIKTGLCHLLETISITNVTQELCLILGQSRRVLQAVVSLVYNRTDGQAAEAAVRAISGICSLEANRCNAVRKGAVDALVLSSSERRKTSSLALATLATLAGTDAGKNALIKNSNAVQVLVKSVFRPVVSTTSSATMMMDNEGSEHAVGLLLVVCRESAKARAEAVNAGVLTQVLLLLQSQCGCRAKAKARALLKVLRSVWARDPAAGLGANFYHVV